MYNRPPLGDRNTKVCICGDVPDVITPVKFHVDRLRGFRPPEGLKIGVFHWQGSSPLQRFCTTLQTVITTISQIQGVLQKVFSNIVDYHFLTETIFPTMYNTIRSYSWRGGFH